MEVGRKPVRRGSLPAMGIRLKESTYAASPGSSSSNFESPETADPPNLTNSPSAISPFSMTTDTPTTPEPASPKTILPATSNSKSRSKRKSSQSLEEISEGMGDMVIGDKRPCLATTPSFKRVDWSRVTSSAYAPQPSPEASKKSNDGPLLDDDVLMKGSVPTSSPAEKLYVIRESTLGGMGMFAAKDIHVGTVIAEEQSLVRLLAFDVQTTEDDPFYHDIVGTLTRQFVQLDSQGEVEFIDSLEPFLEPQLGEGARLLNIMRKYGFESFHPEFTHSTALFRNICRVNHSCDFSNACLMSFDSLDCSNGSLTAQREIGIGEEVLVDYTTVAWRQSCERSDAHAQQQNVD
ncbi:hypothetical protein N431DRAFT_544312 [Stipitochalara longipes BDJ]|nr:hypothetical protein N431DRAFT_544312 [Stipitochalara longipes BDJ]